jgi:hypothetical protein
LGRIRFWAFGREACNPSARRQWQPLLASVIADMEATKDNFASALELLKTAVAHAVCIAGIATHVV